MERTPEEIEAALTMPEGLAEAVLAVVARQDADRGDWPSPREAEMPDPPWPDEDSPVLEMLLGKARDSLDAGMDPKVALVQLAVHAWFESGIENYDRGQRDARRPRPI